MRVHIVGPGVVGKATGAMCARFDHEVVYTDKGDDHKAVQADVHFVCTPEEAAEEVVRDLASPFAAQPRGNIVIRSSTPPGTTHRLAIAVGKDLIHNPEFLREATAEDDMLYATRVVLGTTAPAVLGREDPPGARVADLYHTMGMEVLWLTSEASEMVKLVTNAHLAMLISFWNEISGLCALAGVNSHAIAKVVAFDPRISQYGAYKHGAPYGGACLPKDVEQLIKFAQWGPPPSVSVTHLLSAVKLVNEEAMK